VLKLLIDYSKSSGKYIYSDDLSTPLISGALASAASNPHLLDCISSWLREIPSADVVNSPLLDAVVHALSVESSFEAAVDCMCTIYRDTREVDESLEVIQLLYPRIVALTPKIAETAGNEDLEAYKGITRLFAEAAESWVVLIARLPVEFRSLVEAVLECCARDRDRDAFSLTFRFWYDFKQLLSLERYQTARLAYADVYSKLVDIMIKHLEYPTPVSGDEKDLFDGDREMEERYREFRHQIGDVLKDCCEVITVTECLGKAFDLIQHWIQTYGNQATNINVPHWQELEAPLFAMRAMGRMVSPEESIVMHQVIPLMVRIPDHEKLRFQAIMALGRYTEWTAQHPEFLQSQLEFVIAGFSHHCGEVVRAAALAFRFFGTDCRKLLQGNVIQLQSFYSGVLNKLPYQSQEELTEGVACVISAVPKEKIYEVMKLYCDPIMDIIKTRASAAKGKPEDDPNKHAVAGMILLANQQSEV
jgi:transportin-3